MARREVRLSISSRGRDSGKVFLLTEMPADQAEWWGIRTLCALSAAGLEVPEESTGMAGLAVVKNLLASLMKIPPQVLKPLLDEMFECVKYQHDPKHPPMQIVAGEASQIEEVATRLEIREALLDLHLGFSLRGAPPISASAHPLPTPAA